MKQVSITSVLCGTTIILAPIVHSLFSLGLVAYLLSRDPTQHVNLSGMLENSYQSWCLFIGLCLLMAGAIMGFRCSQVDAAAPMAKTEPMLAPAGNA